MLRRREPARPAPEPLPQVESKGPGVDRGGAGVIPIQTLVGLNQKRVPVAWGAAWPGRGFGGRRLLRLT